MEDGIYQSNGASVWIAPLEMDSSGARVENGVGVGAAYKGPFKGSFKGPLKSVYGHLKDQMAVMRSCKTTFRRRRPALAPMGGYP